MLKCNSRFRINPVWKMGKRSGPGPISCWSFHVTVGIKACLHILMPCPSPSQSSSKFNIVQIVTGSLTGRMGDRPILPVKLPITIDTMLSFDSDGDGVGMCKQTLRGDRASSSLVFSKPVLKHIRTRFQYGLLSHTSWSQVLPIPGGCENFCTILKPFVPLPSPMPLCTPPDGS